MIFLDSRFWGGKHISGGKFDAFFNDFCVLGVFLGIWDSGGWVGGREKSSQEIAGINTVTGIYGYQR